MATGENIFAGVVGTYFSAVTASVFGRQKRSATDAEETKGMFHMKPKDLLKHLESENKAATDLKNIMDAKRPPQIPGSLGAAQQAAGMMISQMGEQNVYGSSLGNMITSMQGMPRHWGNQQAGSVVPVSRQFFENQVVSMAPGFVRVRGIENE